MSSTPAPLKIRRLWIFLPEDFSELARADAVINSVGLTLSVGESLLRIGVPKPDFASCTISSPWTSRRRKVIKCSRVRDPLASVSVFRFLYQAIRISSGAHFNNLEDSDPVENENNPNGSNNSASQNAPQTQLPPPIMLFVEKNYKAQMAAITKAFPKIRSRLTGEFLKLYTDSAEERRMAVQHLTMLDFQFYTIKSKAERPIKVVIKGLPRNTNPEEIKQDLEILGYTPDRVNQLIGRKNKRPLPIFLITLPRNLDNLKIFALKTINYLSIRVEGYDGRGVTQCYTCNNFNHSSENCHLKPRCLKCGENHLTRDCPIKQKLETPYCINCNIYGHMANYRGCPSFPKPPKGAAKNNRNSYTNIYNSLVRPNISYAQATTGAINSKSTPQMATRGPGSSAQTETNKPISPNNRYNNNHFPNFNRRNNNFNFNNMNNNNNINIQTTLQMTMHCLMQLSQILCNGNNLNTNQQLNPNQMYAQIEASCNNINNV
ncbi:nucleic-acid-binding protein from transposon X-element [Trichonephila clavipes]|nr:nucleic-acid-binding protein from transposon X-element [Trichonephila clavipes]